MCVAIDTFRYVVPYSNIFGGVVAMQREHVLKVKQFFRTCFVFISCNDTGQPVACPDDP